MKHSRAKYIRHGMSRTRPSNIWHGIKRRCYNKNEKTYERYGAKGIKMSDEWRDSFMNFWNDMKDTYFDEAQIDRIDNSKGYCKENCRWATWKEQQNNKTSVILYEHNGLKINASDWDKKLGFKKGTVRARIKEYVWDIEKALTTRKKPVKGYCMSRGLYQVDVKYKGKRYFVGRFKTKSGAKKAREEKLRKLQFTIRRSL